MAQIISDIDATDINQNINVVDTGKDILAGAAGGISQVLIGQPFGGSHPRGQEIKQVHIQLTSDYKIWSKCVFKPNLRSPGVLHS